MDRTTNLTCPTNFRIKAAVENDEHVPETNNTNTDCHPHLVAARQNFSPYPINPLFRRHVTESFPNNLANQTPADLVPAATPGQAPTRSSGWTMELFHDYLMYHNCPYEKDVFGEDFYWQAYLQHFTRYDIFFDWIATAYTKDEKCNGATRIRQYLLPREKQSRETIKLLGDTVVHDDGIVGYLGRVLERYPIDSHHLRQLEAMFAGNELELDATANFDKLSEERREFYQSHTQKKKKNFFDNIYSYLKDNPYRLERNTALKALIDDFDRNGAGQPFHEYVLERIITLKNNQRFGTDISSLPDRSIHQALLTLDDFCERCHSALYRVGVANQFYVAARRQEQERRDQSLMA